MKNKIRINLDTDFCYKFPLYINIRFIIKEIKLLTK